MIDMHSERFTTALTFATELHAGQKRKGSDTPYIAHLLGVAALVLENGGDEDQAIAALLHDAVEDQGGAPRLDEIRNRFGSRVADIVLACTDTVAVPEPPWRERKEAYLSSIASKTPDALLVTIADKLHNARAILRDYREVGDVLWQRFEGKREGTLWYYQALIEEFRRVTTLPPLTELQLTVSDLMKQVDQKTQPGS